MWSKRARGAATVALALLMGVGSVACSDDSAARDPGVANPPERELASLIGDQGAVRYRLDAQDAAAFTTIVLATRGLDAADRSCSAPAVAAVLSPDAQGRVSLARFGRMVNRLDDATADLAKQVAACESAATKARVAKQESAGDLDLSGFMALASRMAAGQAAAVGFTDAEAQCYARHALDGVDVRRFARAVVGYEDSQGADPVGAVSACLKKDRLADLVVAGRKMKAEYDACTKQRADEQAKAISEAMSSSTTSTVPGATTTTLAPCA